MTTSDHRTLLTDLLDDSSRISYGDDEALTRFKQRGSMILRNIFRDYGGYLWKWNAVDFDPAFSFGGDDAQRDQQAWHSGMNECTALLQTAIDELELFGQDAADTPSKDTTTEPPSSRRVFVVHGHDDGLKETVARTLEKLDLEAVILHEQPNKGRTIIEKFEDYADVSFAVVLLTPDDMAYRSGEAPDTARPRARQNVILELGFFLGKLGRDRVAVLHSGVKNFERPSDYDGVLYIPIDDNGQWQFGLVKELKAAGIDVDANQIT